MIAHMLPRASVSEAWEMPKRKGWTICNFALRGGWCFSLSVRLIENGWFLIGFSKNRYNPAKAPRPRRKVNFWLQPKILSASYLQEMPASKTWLRQKLVYRVS